MTLPLRTEDEAAELLSTYLLKGWAMTAQVCGVESCTIPLMRSRDGATQFCTLHDTLPDSASKPTETPPPKSVDTEITNTLVPANTASSKPPNPLSFDLFTSESELQLRRDRREQSSKASQLIGQKMLQRWTLMNDQCPNASCYAVPLVRNPDTQELYCVICESTILTEKQAEERTKKLKMKEIIPVEEEPIEEIVQPTPVFQKPRNIERKRPQSAEEVDDSSPSDAEHQNPIPDTIVTTLSEKLDQLTKRMKHCHDPAELILLFKSIKHCAQAMKSCLDLKHK
ncbi:hypothetical protein BDB01DRAFT_750284 [Pilobolus umbonatus]|nr:hypothetical protein BDB01DRAFT_750284 [Pilobolus umbonatus]